MTDPEPALVGIDFTASTLRIALADLDGQVLHRQDFPLPPLEDEDAWAWEVGGRVATCFAAEGIHRWAAGIGISCPGIVDPIAGRIVESTVVEAWDGLNVVAALRRHIDAPIVAIGPYELRSPPGWRTVTHRAPATRPANTTVPEPMVWTASPGTTA